MLSDEVYKRQYNDVVLEEAREADKIEGKYPFRNSEWKKQFEGCMNKQEAHGDLLRSTFLSGGALFMSHVVCMESMVPKARDIDKGCVLTDAEVAHNCEGIRLFFELDYRTTTTLLPTWTEALLHLRVLYRTVQECFPQLEPLTMHVATCTRKRKHRRVPQGIALAWGMHVVFPDIVTTSSVMKLIAQLLDTRISNLFPLWSNIVDPASYHSSNATLRPCFSYKMIDCPICTVGGKPKPSAASTTGKRQRLSCSEEAETRFRLQLSSTCSCFGGRRVDPSVYTYAGSLSSADGAFVCRVLTTYAVLTTMSITPTHMGTFTDGFQRPADMGDEHDGIPQGDALFPVERQAVKGFQRRKNTVPVNVSRFPSGYHAILQALQNIHEAYRYLAIHKVIMDEKKRTFLITVKGNGSRYCLYRNGFHSSNRVYFCLDLKRGSVATFCFDPDCKRAHANKPVKRTVSLVDRHRIAEGFGIPETLRRPTISPIIEHEAPAVVPPVPSAPQVQVSKLSVWEEKQRAYKLLLST
jgi:hypothetical protein